MTNPAPSAPPPPELPREITDEEPWLKFGVSQHEYDYMTGLFISFDDDDGGTLDRAELTRLARWLNYPHQDHDIDNMFRQMDQDNSGSLSLDEFLTFYVDKRPDSKFLYGMSQREYNEVLMQFHTYDSKRSGYLNAKDFHRLMEKQGFTKSEEQSNEIFSKIDSDNNGVIDMHEFLVEMKPYRNKVD
ncbi:Caltractin [Diplonema papillatum]|nr:Caltractin [Diplonema papillatum]